MREFPIIEKLGGRDAVLKRLRARGVDIKSTDALRMWAQRGQIPGHAQQALMAIAEMDGIGYGAADFTVRDDDAGEQAA